VDFLISIYRLKNRSSLDLRQWKVSTKMQAGYLTYSAPSSELFGEFVEPILILRDSVEVEATNSCYFSRDQESWR
jgi:hypothetical protein